MKKRDIRFASIPSTEEVAAERERLAYQNRYQRVLRSTVYILVVVAAAACCWLRCFYRCFRSPATA